MLALFRTYQLVVHAVVLIYLAVLWLPSFLVEVPVPVEPGGYVMQWLHSVLPEYRALHLALALLLVWLQGGLLSQMVLNYRMGAQGTLFSGLMLAWYCSSAPDLIQLSPPLVGNTFLIMAMHQAFTLYRSNEAARALFNTGFLISMAALCYFPLVVLAVLVWFGIGILRSHRLQETLQYAVGLGLPWFLLFLIYYWAGPEASWAELAGLPDKWPPVFTGPQGWRLPAQAAVLGTLLLVLIGQSRRLGYGETIQVQKYLSLAYLMLLGAGAGLLLPGVFRFDHMLTAALPAAMLSGIWLTRLPPRVAETVHFLMLLAILLVQYYPLL